MPSNSSGSAVLEKRPWGTNVHPPIVEVGVVVVGVAMAVDEAV
jgi:hypothetical protein